MMDHNLPDLVRDSELETHFLPDCNTETVHTYHERSPYSRGLVSRSEHWRRLRKIGGGGFGTVWLERCIKGGQPGIELRAVKHLDMTPNAKRLDYSRELEAIAKFSQWKYERCFVKSFGWFQSPEHLFISMEYLELGDLHHYLQDKAPLSEPDAKDISYQILDGLCLMHDNGFAHRDLKLNNILLKSCPPNGWWVKIGDFGISKRVEDGLGALTTTKGTVGYMAPEILGFTERGRPYAIDVWAVGEITFQLLTKKPTFKNPGLLSKYVNNPELFPVDVLQAAHISQSGVDFVLSTMHPMPDKRITAQAALEHAWMDQPLSGLTSHTRDVPSHGPATSKTTDSQDEEFASWDTGTDPKPAITAVGKEPDDTKTSTSYRRTEISSATSGSGLLDPGSTDLKKDTKLDFGNHSDGQPSSTETLATQRETSLNRPAQSNASHAPTGTPQHATSRMSRPIAVALWEYKKIEDTDISFPKGAIITNIEAVDSGWWLGDYGDQRGLFPANYVSLIGDTGAQNALAIAAAAATTNPTSGSTSNKDGYEEPKDGHITDLIKRFLGRSWGARS
ncbi:kinase-like domain-containing protein [Aspergillus floccosus]